MSVHQPHMASTLIQELGALNVAFPSILEDEDARAKALYLVHKLRIALEKPNNEPLRNSALPAQSTVARIAVEMKLFDYLANGSEAKTVERLAVETSCDPVLMMRILRLLAAMGWAEQVKDDSFKPTEIAETLKNSKALQAGIKHQFDIAFPIYAKLPEYFRKFGYKSPHDERDGPFQYAFNVNQTTFDWWAQDPVLSDNFNTFMTGVRGGRLNWVEWFPVQDRILAGHSHHEDRDVLLVDVGGGRGHDLNTFIQKFPDAKGRYVLEDLPAVIDDYQGANSRIEPVKHDFFKEQPIQGARIYFLHHVLHDWPDDAVVKILSHIAKAMKPNYSRVLLGENVLPDRDCGVWKAEMDWAMMVLHCGMTRTVGQFVCLCEKSGLKVIKYWSPPGDGDGIIEAVLEEDDDLDSVEC